MRELFALWEVAESATEILGRRGDVYWFTLDAPAPVGMFRVEAVRFFGRGIGRIDWIGDDRYFALAHSIAFELNEQDMAWLEQHEITPLNEAEDTKALLNYLMEQLASVPRNYELYNGKRNRPTFGTFNEFVKGKVQ